MKDSKLNLLVIIGLSLLSSCKVLYIPNMVNSPLLKEKGEAKINLNTNNLQASYAVTDNVGLMVNGYYNKNDWNITSGSLVNEYQSKRFLVEGGAGYFKSLGEKGVFEAYAGAGYGTLNYNYKLLDNGIEAEYNRWASNNLKLFIQPVIGTTGEKFDFSFFTRFVGLKFSNVDTINYTPAELDFEGLSNVEKTTWMFLEPGVSIRFGTPLIKLQLQTLYSYKLNPEPLNSKNFVFNIGLHVNLSKLTKKE